MSTPSAVSSRSSGDPSAYSSASTPPWSNGTSRATRSKRPAKCSPIARSTSSSPSPVRADASTASGFAVAAGGGAPPRCSVSTLLSTSRRGISEAPISSSTRLHRGDLAIALLLVGRGVGDVQDEVGEQRLLERRGERGHELVRQLAHEADRVGQEVRAPEVVVGARRRIERLEEAVGRRHLGAREHVQERRLADVRVARERHARHLVALAPAAHRRALLAQLAQATAQQRDARARQPAVGLELRLARASRADAAAEALEVLPHAAHALHVVLELRELDLELARRRVRVQREDVEDHARAVDDAHAELVLEHALLARRELVLGHDDLGLELLRQLLQLLELAAADVGARVDARRGAGRACATTSTCAVRSSSRISASSRSSSAPCASTATSTARSGRASYSIIFVASPTAGAYVRGSARRAVRRRASEDAADALDGLARGAPRAPSARAARSRRSSGRRPRRGRRRRPRPPAGAPRTPPSRRRPGRAPTRTARRSGA